jgi:hypothetical protein
MLLLLNELTNHLELWAMIQKYLCSCAAVACSFIVFITGLQELHANYRSWIVAALRASIKFTWRLAAFFTCSVTGGVVYRYKKTLVVVSHDRGFLNEVTTDIIHLHDEALHYYKGNHASFEDMYEQRRRAANKEFDKFTKNMKIAAVRCFLLVCQP